MACLYRQPGLTLELLTNITIQFRKNVTRLRMGHFMTYPDSYEPSEMAPRRRGSKVQILQINKIG